MAKQPIISNASAIAMLDALTALLDGGELKIYAGTKPADPDTALSGETLLAELSLSATAFAAATDGTGKATASANAITDDSSANATGTASFFRAFKSDGTTAVIDGTVGTSAADLILNSTSISAGQNVSVSSWTVEMPEAGQT